MGNESKKFGVIYCDPPWRYSNGGNGASRNHYRDMGEADLLALPVWAWSGESTILVLASTWPFVPLAMRMIESWGFSYVTGFPYVNLQRDPAVDVKGNVQAKPTWGTGVWVRGCSGAFFVARRKKARPPSKHWLGLIGNRLEHSRKPDSIYDYCESMSGPYLEMFARRTRPGWDVWGDDVDDTIDLYAPVARTIGSEVHVAHEVQTLMEMHKSGINRWAMGDSINRIIAEYRMPRVRVYDMVADALGMSSRWVQEISAISQVYRPETRDHTQTWDRHRTMYRKGEHTDDIGKYEPIWDEIWDDPKWKPASREYAAKRPTAQPVEERGDAS